MSRTSIFYTASKSILVLTTAGLMSSAAFVVLTNPEINHLVAREQQVQQRASNIVAFAPYEEWKWDLFSDVSAGEDAYPLVAVRSGHKLIHTDAQQGSGIFGWRYDAANTSPLKGYRVEVDYKLTDQDGFVIASSSASEYVNSQDFGVIQGTIHLDAGQVSRVANSTWTVRLSPEWQSNEISNSARYDRLKDMASSGVPWWITEELLSESNSKLADFSDKWSAIRSGVFGEEKN